MKSKISTSVGLALFFQVLTDLVVILNLAFVREIVGFVYLTFFPGILVLEVLKQDGRDALESFLLSMGLQIALLMFVGLSINILFPILGIASPLSTGPLLGTMNAITLLACLVIYLRPTNDWMSNLIPSRSSIPLVAVPLLSVAGALVANSFGTNSILFLMLLSVAGLIVFGTMYHKSLPKGFFPLAILVASSALLLHSSLATNYISGYDDHGEYHVFKFTDNAAFWNASYIFYNEGLNKGNSMLSDTILPTIYSKVTNIDATWILKILFPLLFAFVPLILYKLYCAHAHFGKKHAFLAVMFLISNLAFFGTDGLANKQMIGELFFALLFLVILETDVASFRKSLLFVIFGAGLVVSHYSMSYIFLFLISSVWIVTTVGQRLGVISHKTMRITPRMILIFFAMSFGWYIYTANSTPFNAIVGVGEHISSSFLRDFFSPSSRTLTVLRGVGIGEVASIGHQIGRIFFFAAEIFITIGMVEMLYKKKQAKFGHDYAMVAVMSFAILVMCIIVPNFAAYFRAERFYQVSLLFLAPFFVSGGASFFNFISRRTSQTVSLSLILLILIPFLLFETGFIYEISGDYSYSVALSKYRMDKAELYERITDESEIAAATWLSTNLDFSTSYVYADSTSIYHVLTSYGMMLTENALLLTNTTTFIDDMTFVYLREVNVDEGIVTAGYLPAWNLSDVQPLLKGLNVLYSNENNIVLGGN